MDKEIPDSLSKKINTLKKEATKYKNVDIKKSIEFLYQAQKINDQYYTDIGLHIRIAKYLTEDKRFNEAFQFLQKTIIKIANRTQAGTYNYHRFSFHLDMTQIHDTDAFICISEGNLNAALFWKLTSLGHDLVFRAYGGYPGGLEFKFENWYSANKNNIYKAILKKAGTSFEKLIIKELSRIFDEYQDLFHKCRKVFVENFGLLNAGDIMLVASTLKVKFKEEELKKDLAIIETIPHEIGNMVNKKLIPLIDKKSKKLN